MADPALLASLRPGMPATALSELIGAGWVAPGDHDRGYVKMPDGLGLGARIDAGGHIGRISFYPSFPAGISIGRLCIGIPFEAAKLAYPEIEPSPGYHPPGIKAFTAAGPDGTEVWMRFQYGILIELDLVQPDAEYPIPPPVKVYPRTALAYDIDILPPGAAAGKPCHGWCLGLPPGIFPMQWPLDPRTGHPMRHAFTLLLPPSHRVKGPDLVAISLFSTDHTDTAAPENVLVLAALDSAEPPGDARLLPVGQHQRGRHPHEYRMTGILDEPYAVLWLTQAEFDGGPCRPPRHPRNNALDHVASPNWVRDGAGVRRALRWTLRADDPNAGIALPDGDDQTTADGYQCYWTANATDEFCILEWAQAHKPNHIGGTMRPDQAHPSPAFSPYYIEFEEEMGGFDFGGGCAQLDLDQMRLEWACL